MPAAWNGDIRLHYEVAGEGEPVVLVPGLGLTGIAWADTREVLRSAHRVIVVDPRGAGESGKPDVPYTGLAFAEDLAAVLDAANVLRTHVVGLSMGGMVAQEFAIRFPERVGALVLVSTYAATDAWSQRLFEVRKTLIQRLGLLEHFKLSIMFVFSPSAFRTMRERVALIEEALTANPPDEAAYLRQLQYCLDHDTRDRLRAITVPTLVLTGSQDILTSPFQGRELADGISGARYQEFAGASHGLWIEQAQEVAATIREFLARHPIGASMPGWRPPGGYENGRDVCAAR